MKTVDLHGFYFEDGKDLIIKTMNECIVEGDPVIEIIHGYHGRIFKDYLESMEFLDDMENEGIYLEDVCERPNPGKTIFRIKNVFKDTQPQ